MRRWLWLATLATAACGAEEDIEPPTGAMAVEVKRYDYQLDLDTRAATSTLTLDVTEPGNCLSVRFRATGLQDVTLDGEPIADGSLEGERLVVCGAGWEAGAEVLLEADSIVPEETWEPLQVGFSVTEDLAGNPFTYLVSWVGGCDRFGPCDPAPDRFAHYRFEVTHPAGTTVLCPGTLDPGERISACDFAYDGGPTYSTFGLAASESWTPIDLGDWGGVRATLYDSEAAGLIDHLSPDAHAEFLQFMVDAFGPYPYGDELRMFSGPTYWRGFEHPGNIALAEGLEALPSSYTYPVQHTVHHEIAHMWAGDQTTLADPYDFVWKEAMAEYLAFLFRVEREPAAGAATARYWRAAAHVAEYWPVPGDRPPLVDYYGDAYGPGPMILFRQTEAMFGRDAVVEALQSLLGRPRAIGVADVQAALEATTGADLAAYFDAWVYGEGTPVWPSVTVDVADNGDGTVTVTADQIVDGDTYFGVAFPIRLLGDAEGDQLDVWLDFGADGAARATADATPGFAVTDWRVDPEAYSIVRESTAAAAAPPPEGRNPWVANP